MKRKLYLSAITFVIVGLLITSVSGMMNFNTQEMTEEIENEEIENEVIEDSGILQTSDIAIQNDVMSAPELSQVNKGSFNRQVTSMPNVAAESRIREETRYDLYALHPGVGTEPHVDGVSENAVLSHWYYYYDVGPPIEEEGPAVLLQGTNDNFQTWGPGLYYVNDVGDPLDLDYPSVHFRGYANGTGDTMFSGTMRDGVNGGTNGGATYILEVIGDPTVNTSYTLSHWDWNAHGWFGAVMAENAGTYYSPDYEWAWGFNSHVMSTTYGTYPATDYRTNGCFINYQTDDTGYGTISWYLEFGGCLSTDAIIDSSSTWFANGSDVPFAAYAVWDPSTFNGTTYTTHYMCLRAFDWAGTCPLGDANAYDSMYWWNASENYSMEHPAIVAHDGTIIVIVEIVNMSNPAQVDLAIYNTHDGDPANLNLSAYLSLVTPGALLNPDVQWVDGDTFLAHFSAGIELLTMVTYDGGDSWDGPYVWYNATHPALVNEYRNVDISDESRVSFWEVDNSTVMRDAQFVLRYTFNTANYKGDCTYEYGDDAPLSLVTITNENTSRVLNANIEDPDDDGTAQHYQRDLIYGLDLWTDAVITLHAEDTTVPAYENTTQVSGEIDNVETFDLVLYQPRTPELEITLTGGVGIHSAFLPQYADDYTFTVTATDANGDPVQGIPAGDFDLSIALGTTTLSCCPISAKTTFTANDAQTDANGECDFTVEILTSVSRNSLDPTPNGGFVTITADHDDYDSDSADIPVNACDHEPDCTIDLTDFASFALDFGLNRQRSDYNFDGVVDLTDFANFALQFGFSQGC